MRNRISNYLLALVLTFGLTAGIHAAEGVKEKQLDSAFTGPLIVEGGTNDFAADQSMGGNKLTNVADGTASGDAVNKGQLDAQSSGLSPKASVRVHEDAILDDDADITGSPAYVSTDGTAARGQIVATLAQSGVYTVDGIAMATNDRMLVGGEGSGTVEIHGVDTVADSSGSLNSTFFTFFTNFSTGIYVWFDINGAGVDPNPSPAAGTTFTGITVAAATDVTANALALLIETAIEASAAEVDDVVVSTNEITITNSFGGNVTNVADGSAATSFTIATDQAGTGLGADANGIYVVTIVTTTLTLDRATDFDEDAEVGNGAYMLVGEGTVHATHGHILLTVDPVTIGGAGGTSLTFGEFSKLNLGTVGEITTNEAGTAAAAGTSGNAAHADHQHDTATATATSASAGQSNAEGAGTDLARATHTHQHTRAAPASNLGGTSSNATGASGNFSDASHTHAVDTGATTAATVGQTGSAGSGNNLAHANHEHTHASGTALNVSTANAQGSSNNFADAQHLHDSPQMTDANKREAAAVTTGTNETTGLTIASTPALDTAVWIVTNTLVYDVGDGNDLSHYYYSGDACTTPRATAAIVAGDVLCQGDALPFNHDTADDISQMYQTFTNN